MYKQLLTYEIRAQVRSDVRILAALVAVVAASIGVRALDIPGLSTITEMLAYALCVAMPVVVAIMGLVDYWKTLYGQRGYFTMSLPASGAQIFWAKLPAWPWPAWPLCLSWWVGWWPWPPRLPGRRGLACRSTPPRFAAR